VQEAAVASIALSMMVERSASAALNVDRKRLLRNRFSASRQRGALICTALFKVCMGLRFGRTRRGGAPIVATPGSCGQMDTQDAYFCKISATLCKSDKSTILQGVTSQPDELREP
jgi:hypothetical protein